MVFFFLGSGCGRPPGGGQHTQTILRNVSYDPTREFYQEFNAAFAKHWRGQGNGEIVIEQSHGGSGKQARSVIDGLEADVVTLALAYDIDAIAERAKLLPSGWQSRLPLNSCPFTSTIVFVTRKGNPKGIKDWDDLVKPGVAVIAPNPKTSGGARWIYLAAWGYAQLKPGGGESMARQFVTGLYKNVPVLDSGARGSTTTFVQRKLGDVLLCWENEAYLARKEFPGDHLEIVVPSVSIRAEPPVAVVDVVVDRHGTRKAAEEYLRFLYSAEGQEIAGRNHYRPTLPEVARKYEGQFANVKRFGVDEVFGSWRKAQELHFNDNGVFDGIYQPGS